MFKKSMFLISNFKHSYTKNGYTYVKQEGTQTPDLSLLINDHVEDLWLWKLQLSLESA